MFKTFRQTLQTIIQVSKRNAGHSKWQNIRHIKGAKDMERANMFTKLGRQMKVAITEGGSVDPKHNLKLNQVIEQAKRANMPVATIQSIIKSCQADKTQSKTYTLEIKGPGSCIIICDVFTSNLSHFKQQLANILKKHGSKHGDGGGIHSFEEKGIIETNLLKEMTSKTAEEIIEQATDHAIESGAEDVKLHDKEGLQFLCGKTNLTSVVSGLEKLNYSIESASVEYIPLKLQPLEEADLQLCDKLYEKLQGLPEVIRLSDNIA